VPALRLREHAEQARLYRRLTRIALDASSIDTLQRQPRQPGQLEALCEQLRLGAFTRSRLRALLR